MSPSLQNAIALGVVWAACFYLLLTSFLDFRHSGEIHLLSYRLVDTNAHAFLAIMCLASILLLALSLQQIVLHLKNRDR
ncbi:MAG: hypothetical protein QNJ40_13090 [Xanthomonadales bacterium]|nr:hypothetical protein [Xanthomonadales bacterium]